MAETITLILPGEVVNGGLFRPAPTNARFDSQLLAPHIQTAEERFIIPVLCREFYADLKLVKDGVVSNYNPDVDPPGMVVEAYPSNPQYEKLWTTYLMRLCGLAVYFVSLPYIGIQTGSHGLFVTNTEFGDGAGVKGAKYLQNETLQSIRTVTKEMEDFLCRNADDYPLYPSCDKCKECGCSKCKEGEKCSKNDRGRGGGGVVISSRY